jgi:ribosomal-protein-alanine N-acetyltransferase
MPENNARLIPPEIIETARLRLRLPRPEDADVIFQEYAQDPEVLKYLMWRLHDNIQTTRAFVKRCLKVWQAGAVFPWVITLKDDGRLAGMLELCIDGHRADLGYVLARSYWGRGYATEAVKAVTAWALAQPAIYRVWAVCDVENIASARVLEKAGMQREGILRRYILHTSVSAEPRDVYCYAMVK